MNSQKTIIALALVVAIIALGVAYAAITNQTLVIEGSASAEVSDGNFDVKFIGAPTTGGEGTVVAELDSTDTTSRKAKMNVSGLTTAGQAATATFTIKNASPAEVTAALTAKVTQTNEKWFNVKAEIANPTLAKDGETTLLVTVTLLDTPATDADVEAAKESINISIDAAAQ